MIDRLRKAVFLDRDGVLIESLARDSKPYAVDRFDDVRIMGGVHDACHRLSQKGYVLVMVTNQPDVARGKITKAFVDSVNSRLALELCLTAVQVCYHDDVDNCECRKPKPGMLLRAAQDLGIALESSFLVGDRWRDIDAGHAAGCKTIFIDHGYNETLRHHPSYIAPSLAAATDRIIQHDSNDGA